MSGNVSYPNGFVESVAEKEHVWVVYGREAERAGFREKVTPASQVKLMNSGLFTDCGITLQKDPAKLNPEDYWDHCGAFRVDHYAAPVWLPIRDTDISDLPSR